MRLTSFSTSFFVAAMLSFVMPASAAKVQPPQRPVKIAAASRATVFIGEANSIFEDLRSDATHAEDHADLLQSFAFDRYLSRNSYTAELSALKQDVNDMGAKLYDLETIRRECAPWQRAEIDRIAVAVRRIAGNTGNAIRFCNNHPNSLWLSSYQTDLDNLYNETASLKHTLSKAVAYEHASKEYRNLERELKIPASS